MSDHCSFNPINELYYASVKCYENIYIACKVISRPNLATCSFLIPLTEFLLCLIWWCIVILSLHRRHRERNGVSNHRRLDCLLHRLFRRRSKKTSKLRVTGVCEGNPSVTDGFPHKGPVTRKMFSFDEWRHYDYGDQQLLNMYARGHLWYYPRVSKFHNDNYSSVNVIKRIIKQYTYTSWGPFY